MLNAKLTEKFSLDAVQAVLSRQPLQAPPKARLEFHNSTFPEQALPVGGAYSGTHWVARGPKIKSITLARSEPSSGFGGPRRALWREARNPAWRGKSRHGLNRRTKMSVPGSHSIVAPEPKSNWPRSRCEIQRHRPSRDEQRYDALSGRSLHVQSAGSRQKKGTMRRTLFVAVCAIFTGLSPLFGQGITLVGSGYSSPTSIRVSPGQITTMFVLGLSTDPTKPTRATSVPLPTSLAGISVDVLVTSSAFATTTVYPAPLLAVEQFNVCGNGATPPPPTGSPDCMVGAITLQIPYEALPLTRSGDFAGSPTTEIVITANGTTSKSFPVSTYGDNLHVLSTCDSFPSKQSGSQIILNGGCNSVVTHADGTLVTADSPALPGETVVIYAYGLGQTTPSPKTGQASPTPAATLSTFLYLQFDFRINAAPSRPYVNPLILAPIPTPAPVFAGLTPGQVGLYQVNVRVPNPPTAIPNCTTGAQALSLYNAVQSNLTIDIGAPASFDGAAICVNAGVQPLAVASEGVSAARL